MPAKKGPSGCWPPWPRVPGGEDTWAPGAALCRQVQNMLGAQALWPWGRWFRNINEYQNLSGEFVKMQILRPILPQVLTDKLGVRPRNLHCYIALGDSTGSSSPSSRPAENHGSLTATTPRAQALSPVQPGVSVKVFNDIISEPQRASWVIQNARSQGQRIKGLRQYGVIVRVDPQTNRREQRVPERPTAD